eukprot:g6563.t1
MSDNYCRVYDKEALRMLVVENELEDRARIKKQNSLNAKKSGSKSVSVKRSSLVASESEKQLREKERADVRYQRFKYAQKIREKKEKLEKKERMEAAAKRKEDLFRYWNGRVNDPEEKAQVQAVHKWLDQHQAKEETKLRKLHEAWDKNIYSRISKYVNEKLETRDHAKYKETVRREFQNYVDLTNKKGTIFRDIFVESEYDPFVINRETIRFKEKLVDPVKRLLDKRKEELGQIKGGWLIQQDKEGGRETLDIELWQTGKIENTPHGLAAKFGQPPKPKTELELKLTRSRVKMDHFNVLTGEAGQKQLDAEIGPGKRPIPGRGGTSVQLG